MGLIFSHIHTFFQKQEDAIISHGHTFRVLVFSLAFLLTAGTTFARESLDATLKSYLYWYELPALAAAAVRNGEIVAAGAVGTRKAGEQIPVTLNDRFHLGSDTKAMTALLAATLVESGKLKWDSTVAEVFPELTDSMEPTLRPVTLTQLLSHTSGIPGDNEEIGALLQRATLQEGNLDDIRYWIVQQWCLQPLASVPGTKFAYSNMGYLFAGAMIERVARATWEELITERVFIPLGLNSAGLGPQSSPGKVDAPLGHAVVDGKIKPFLAGPNGDNPLYLGPAGTVHMSVLDFARWAGWNAGEGKRGPHLVSPATLKKLHTPIVTLPLPPDSSPGSSPSHYCLGWGKTSVDWAPEQLLSHSGSNQKNLAFIFVDPQKDFAEVLMTNIYDKKAEQALKTLAAQLYARFADAPASDRAQGNNARHQKP